MKDFNERKFKFEQNKLEAYIDKEQTFKKCKY